MLCIGLAALCPMVERCGPRWNRPRSPTTRAERPTAAAWAPWTKGWASDPAVRRPSGSRLGALALAVDLGACGARLLEVDWPLLCAGVDRPATPAAEVGAPAAAASLSCGQSGSIGPGCCWRRLALSAADQLQDANHDHR